MSGLWQQSYRSGAISRQETAACDDAAASIRAASFGSAADCCSRCSNDGGIDQFDVIGGCGNPEQHIVARAVGLAVT